VDKKLVSIIVGRKATSAFFMTEFFLFFSPLVNFSSALQKAIPWTLFVMILY